MANVLASGLARMRWWGALLLAAASIAACGGGDDAPLTSRLQPSAAVESQCVAPRPPGTVDPLTSPQQLYGDRPGTHATEKAWVRSWIDETYLWYAEVADFDPAAYPTAPDYFEVLKTPLLTASGKPKDEFHFSYATPEWVALTTSGAEIGYGIEFAAFSSSVPRRYVVAYVEPNGTAFNQVARGAELITVDGVDFANGTDVATLNNAIFPTTAGQSHTFTFRDVGAASNRTVTLTSAQVTRTPVQNVSILRTATGNVGYFQFNDHLFTSELQLVDAVNALIASGPINDLVLDLRYNGGGLLDVASELAYMVAGAARTNGKVFERLRFNDKQPFGAVPPTPFHATTQGFSLAAGQPLPQLGLGRVFVLAGGDTASASESIINGLRGAGVQVIQIGQTTRGKPYGFYPEENCGTTYFAIQFDGVNHLGFGDYADGFVPGGAGPNGVPGCVVDDDFAHALGDPSEARLNVALTYRATGTCPALAAARDSPASLRGRPEAQLIRTPARENRFNLR